MNYDSAKVLLGALMDNEGKLFFDCYGREWKCENFIFTFKDIGCNSINEEGLKRLHLSGTFIEIKED